MKRILLSLLACVVMAACTSSKAKPDAEEAAAEAKPQGIKHVAPERVESALTPENVATCLDEPVDIASIAGQYYGPIDMTEGQVEEARGLEVELGTVEMLEKDEFADRLENGAPKIDRDKDLVNRWLLWGLGYVPIGEVGSAAPPGGGAHFVAGFYDPRSKDIVVRQKGELDEEYITLAHEIGHAAVDQNFGLKKGTLRLIDDKALAYDSVVEGDASLVELRFASQFSKPKLIRKGVKRLIRANDEYLEDRAKGTPQGIIDQFIFPYQNGLTFICSVFKERGWKGVNRLYKNPPTSTAEIMFPDRYLKGQKPKDPPAFNRLPKGWKEYGSGTIGSATLLSLFQAPGDLENKALDNALGRAAAWNGGEYKVWAKYENSIDHVIAMSFVEHPQHKGVLCSSMVKWYEAAYPIAEKKVIADHALAFSESSNVGGNHLRSGVITCRDGVVRLATAPDPELAKAAIGL